MENERLNENEVEKVAGGVSIAEKLEYRPIPSGLIDDFGPIPRKKNCSVCGKPIIVYYARPPMVGCPASICDECAKKEREEERKAKTQ